MTVAILGILFFCEMTWYMSRLHCHNSLVILQMSSQQSIERISEPLAWLLHCCHTKMQSSLWAYLWLVDWYVDWNAISFTVTLLLSPHQIRSISCKIPLPGCSESASEVQTKKTSQSHRNWPLLPSNRSLFGLCDARMNSHAHLPY